MLHSGWCFIGCSEYLANQLNYWDLIDAKQRKYSVSSRCVEGNSLLVSRLGSQQGQMHNSNLNDCCSQPTTPVSFVFIYGLTCLFVTYKVKRRKWAINFYLCNSNFFKAVLDEFAGSLYTETSEKRLRWECFKMVVSIHDYGDIERIRITSRTASTELLSGLLLFVFHTTTPLLFVWSDAASVQVFQTTAESHVRLVRLQSTESCLIRPTPSTAVARWQGRGDIYQAGLATCCEIYPRLCLTQAALPRPSIGAAARGDKWDRKLRQLHVYETEGGRVIHHSAVWGKKWMKTLNIYERRWEPHY